jgi:cell division protein FtsN
MTSTSKIIAGQSFANRVLVLETHDLAKAIEHLVPQFVYCGKPIEGKNVQHKLEVAIGYEVKTQKLADVRRLKVELVQLPEGAEPTNKVKTTKESFANTEATLTTLATMVTEILAAEAAAKEAAKPVKEPKVKAETPVAETKTTEVKEPEAKAAQAPESTFGIAKPAPQRDPATGRFLKRA